MDYIAAVLHEYEIPYDITNWIGASGEPRTSITADFDGYNWVIDLSDSGEYLVSGFRLVDPERFGEPIYDCRSLKPFLHPEDILAGIGFDVLAYLEEQREATYWNNEMYKQSGYGLNG